MLVSRLADAEATEARAWLDFSPDCACLSSELRKQLVARYEEIGMVAHGMIEHPERFAPSSQIMA
jgi:hypothetical protein